MTNSLAAIIFDMDGVLVDTESYHYRAWQQVAAQLGVSFGPDHMRHFLGRRRRECLLDLVGNQAMDEAEIQRYLDLKDRVFMDAISTMSGESLLPGVMDFILDARTHRLKMGVASSSANARIVLERTGVLEYMDAVGDGTTVRRGKPAPDVFLWVAGALLAKPHTVAVFEDSAAGIEAAMTAGMYVVGIGSECARAGAPICIAQLSQISVDELVARLATHHA